MGAADCNSSPPTRRPFFPTPRKPHKEGMKRKCRANVGRACRAKQPIKANRPDALCRLTCEDTVEPDSRLELLAYALRVLLARRAPRLCRLSRRLAAIIQRNKHKQNMLQSECRANVGHRVGQGVGNGATQRCPAVRGLQWLTSTSKAG